MQSTTGILITRQYFLGKNYCKYHDSLRSISDKEKDADSWEPRHLIFSILALFIDHLVLFHAPKAVLCFMFCGG